MAAYLNDVSQEATPVTQHAIIHGDNYTCAFPAVKFKNVY